MIEIQLSSFVMVIHCGRCYNVGMGQEVAQQQNGVVHMKSAIVTPEAPTANGTVGTIVDMTQSQANKLQAKADKKAAREARQKAKLVRTIVGDIKTMQVQVVIGGVPALTMQVKDEAEVWAFIKMQLTAIPGVAQVEILK